MNRFEKEERAEYTDLSTVESERNDLIPEEFPEGPYGSDLQSESLGKSTPWRKDQRSPNRFDYEDRQQHMGMERDFPGADETIQADPGQNNHSKE